MGYNFRCINYKLREKYLLIPSTLPLLHKDLCTLKISIKSLTLRSIAMWSEIGMAASLFPFVDSLIKFMSSFMFQRVRLIEDYTLWDKTEDSTLHVEYYYNLTLVV